MQNTTESDPTAPSHGAAMPRKSRVFSPRLPATLAVLVTLAVFFAQARGGEPSAEQVRFFEAKVRPLLIEHCLKCHGPEKPKAHLRLDSRAGVLAGGDLGPAVVPGKPAESLLVAAVRQDDDAPKMPPSRKLAAEATSVLARWVEMGVPWPGTGVREPPTGSSAATPGVRRGPMNITEADRAHWAFRPVNRPAAPRVHHEAWVRNPIDAFVLALLEQRGLEPSPSADRPALIRRVTYDLTGLPPTPREVAAFEADPAPDAYERLVDRLLASPRYGEKWARHWLDLVRFAETNSYERDNPKPSAWRYRDYVVRSLNRDKPYDRFVREQLAGDELADGGPDGLIATGYYRLGIWDDEPTDRELARYDGLDDIVATTGQVFLGLTVDCARCHDHKIDPIPQADYYRLLAFFQNVNHYRNGGPTDEAPIADHSENKAATEARVRERESQFLQTWARIASIENDFLARGGAGKLEPSKPPSKAELANLIRTRGEALLGRDAVENYQTLRRQLRAMETERPTGATALCVSEAGPVAPETHVLLRGNPHVKGPRVEPAFLTVLGEQTPTIPTPPPGARSTGRRSALADWITSSANPLTARVIANRVWQHHFGRGIVRSSSNFGTQGDRPTHPELLDWLASELVAGDWRLKPLHRLILTSNAYRMSSRADPRALAQDPANDAFWRFDMRRLSAEEVRDSVLAVTGTLNASMYGPGVYPEIPADVLAGQSQPGKGWPTSAPRDQARRSLYVHVKRSLLLPILEGFDLAETDRSTPSRFSTTQPTQALAMLNGKFLNDQAAALAARIRREAGEANADRVRLALRLTTGRNPAGPQVERGVAMIEGMEKDEGFEPGAALKAFCLLALNLDEFLYLD